MVTKVLEVLLGDKNIHLRKLIGKIFFSVTRIECLFRGRFFLWIKVLMFPLSWLLRRYQIVNIFIGCKTFTHEKKRTAELLCEVMCRIKHRLVWIRSHYDKSCQSQLFSTYAVLETARSTSIFEQSDGWRIVQSVENRSLFMQREHYIIRAMVTRPHMTS